MLQDWESNEVEGLVKSPVNIWDYSQPQDFGYDCPVSLYSGYLYRMLMPTLIIMETILHVNVVLMDLHCTGLTA